MNRKEEIWTISQKAYPARPGKKKLRQQKLDAYLENKRKRLENPDCIVIAARVLDTHLLAQMLVPLDKSMNTMRIRAGGYSISIEDVAHSGTEIAAWIEKAKKLSNDLSPRSNSRSFSMSVQ